MQQRALEFCLAMDLWLSTVDLLFPRQQQVLLPFPMRQVGYDVLSPVTGEFSSASASLGQTLQVCNWVFVLGLNRMTHEEVVNEVFSLK
jgi:hypothetical protein